MTSSEGGEKTGPLTSVGNFNVSLVVVLYGYKLSQHFISSLV